MPKYIAVLAAALTLGAVPARAQDHASHRAETKLMKGAVQTAKEVDIPTTVIRLEVDKVTMLKSSCGRNTP